MYEIAGSADDRERIEVHTGARGHCGRFSYRSP